MSKFAEGTVGSIEPAKTERWALPHVLFALYIGAIILCLVLLTTTRYFDPDEFQHLEMAWLISKGVAPYRDFFEHHTPLYHLLASGLLETTRYFSVSPVQSIILLRWIAVGLSGAALYLTYLLGRRLGGHRVGGAAVMLLASNSIFLTKAIEIRPDQIGVLAILAASLCAAIATERPSRQSRYWLLLSGICCAVAVMATQKALFVLPGLGVHIGTRIKKAGGSLWPPALMLIAGGIVGSLPVLYYVLDKGILLQFVASNFLGDAMWPRNYQIGLKVVVKTLLFDTLFCALFVAGLRTINRLWAKDDRMDPYGVVVRPLVSLLVGLLVMPIAQQQYILLMLPYAAIVGGWMAIRLLDQAASRWPARRFVPPAAILVCMVYAACHLAAAFARPDAVALDKVRYLTTQTPPESTVLAGWSPGVAFRRPAFFYAVLHNEIRYFVPPAAFEHLIDDWRAGRNRPEIIDFDDDVRAVPSLAAYVAEAYAPTGVSTLWRRKP